MRVEIIFPGNIDSSVVKSLGIQSFVARVTRSSLVRSKNRFILRFTSETKGVNAFGSCWISSEDGISFKKGERIPITELRVNGLAVRGSGECFCRRIRSWFFWR